MIIPDPQKRTVKIPIRIVDGQAEFFYGGPFPKIRNIIGDLVIPAFALVEKTFADECSTEDRSEMLPAGTTLIVNIRVDTSGPGLRNDITSGPLTGNVEVELLEPLYLRHRGTKSSVLDPCKCFVPALEEEATSLNHAYTAISKRFETKRRTNSGNVFKKIYHGIQGNSWEQLERLRKKYDARFEQRFTASHRQETSLLTLADSPVIDQWILCEDEEGRFLAIIDPDGLTLDEYEYTKNKEDDARITVRTQLPNRVLFELIKEKFTTAIEFDSWLEKKGIPVDLRSGFPTKTSDPFDQLFQVFDEILKKEGAENYRSDSRTDSTGFEESILSHLGDDSRIVIVDKESAKRLDEFLGAGWIHVGKYFKRIPFYPSKMGPVRNIPIRIRLEDFSLSKHQRRILKKNADVRVDLEPLAITRQEEELYDQHKRRFSITPPKSIHDVIPLSQLTEIKKFNITENDRLIAVSYLDIGKTSTHSMYAMFEPTIEWRSLGILSILKEIEFSIFEGKEFYYLGFVYDKPSPYDYKRNFRGLELFDWQGNWIKAG